MIKAEASGSLYIIKYADMDHGRNYVDCDLPLGLSASSPQLNSFSSSSSISTGRAAAVDFAFPFRPAGIFKTRAETSRREQLVTV